MRDDIDRQRTAFIKTSALGKFGTGSMRIALLFGSAAIALALIAVPLLEKRTGGGSAFASRFLNLDFTSTGSIERGATYTVRRSVLQRRSDAVCIIRADGSMSGDCP
ncbi:hypothetical protein [Mesorhizobium xinjiangense]|uniref:hypothetical protein n=1 Tax=Mesorhizobium xinjiangense TaxID=2678685 RepID=UPI0012EE4A4B|nr:hypothetical protein [Mesorhizobium xinjiangense]